MDDPRLQSIRALAEPVLTDASAELVELSVRRQGRQVILRFLIDTVGGVTIQDCARLNRALGDAIERAGLLDESYTLEVSSPGLDRPLASKRDFERAIGEQVELQVTDAAASRQVRGMLLAVQDEAVVVTTSTGNVTIPLAQIQRATKAIRFSER